MSNNQLRHRPKLHCTSREKTAVFHITGVFHNTSPFFKHSNTLSSFAAALSKSRFALTAAILILPACSSRRPGALRCSRIARVRYPSALYIFHFCFIIKGNINWRRYLEHLLLEWWMDESGKKLT